MDVYDLGGPVFLKELEADVGKTNLVVIPMTFVERLDDESSRNSGSGAGDVLDDIIKIQSSDQRENIGKDEATTVYSVNAGLDLAIIDRPDIDPDDFSITALEKKVNDLFTSSSGRATLLTSNKGYRIKFSRRDMRIERPQFLFAGSDFVQEGMLEASDFLEQNLYSNPNIPLEEAMEMMGRELHLHQFIQLHGNRYARVTGELVWNKERNVVVDIKDARVELLPQNIHDKKIRIGTKTQPDLIGVKPLDVQQYLAMQYMLVNPDIHVTFLVGGAGSGKTVLGYAAAVDSVLVYDQEERKARGYPHPGKKEGGFKQLVLLKATDTMGGKTRDVGALPGDLYAKIEQHLKGYEDAHKLTDLGGKIPFEEMFKHPRFKGRFSSPRDERYQDMTFSQSGRLPHDSEVIELTYSGFMRGRSLHNICLVVDEAQNFTPHEMQTILGRAGPGTKVIVLGDVTGQFDNPRCSAEMNGLTHAIKHYLPSPFSALMNLTRLHRGPVSVTAASWQPYRPR